MAIVSFRPYEGDDTVFVIRYDALLRYVEWFYSEYKVDEDRKLLEWLKTKEGQENVDITGWKWGRIIFFIEELLKDGIIGIYCPECRKTILPDSVKAESMVFRGGPLSSHGKRMLICEKRHLLLGYTSWIA